MEIPQPEADNPEITTPVEYPPKYQPEITENKPALIKGLYSMVIYLGLGYLLLGRWDLLLIVFAVVALHEAGHFLAMKFYSYSDVNVLFLPFIGAFVKGSKKEISQRQSAVIFLAGPLPGIILGIVLHFISRDANHLHLGNIPLQLVAQLLIWANLLNLLPVYPLDGGQLLNRVFLNEEGRLSNIFIILSAMAITWAAISSKFYILLIFPALFIYRFFSTRSNDKLEKDMELSGININREYEDLSDEDYWKLRTIVLRHTPSLQQIAPGPPYIYSDKEDRIAQEVDNALQRNLIMDIFPLQKIVVLIIWMLFAITPWLFNIDFLLLKYLGR